MKVKKVAEKHYLQGLLDYLRINETEFAKSLNTSRERISRVIKLKNGISSDLANTIIEKYNNVNYNWLRYGEGEMLNENKKSIAKPEEDDYSVPLIPIDAVAGFGTGDFEGGRYENCERYKIPEFRTAKVEFVVHVNGSSMYPKYSSGDILACRKVYDILFFQWGKVYVIDSSQGVLVKRVFECPSEDYILLVSDNGENYPSFSIPKNDIRSLSIVLGVIRME